MPFSSPYIRLPWIWFEWTKILFSSSLLIHCQCVFSSLEESGLICPVLFMNHVWSCINQEHDACIDFKKEGSYEEKAERMEKSDQRRKRDTRAWVVLFIAPWRSKSIGKSYFDAYYLQDTQAGYVGFADINWRGDREKSECQNQLGSDGRSGMQSRCPIPWFSENALLLSFSQCRFFSSSKFPVLRSHANEIWSQYIF